jgi:hypothetical protein
MMICELITGTQVPWEIALMFESVESLRNEEDVEKNEKTKERNADAESGYNICLT